MFRMLPARPGLALVALSILLGSPAVTTAEVPGWFVEADVRSVDASGEVSGFTPDDKDNGFSFGFGYAFNRYLSLQTAYHDMGSHFATDCPPPLLCLVTNFEDVDVTGWSLTTTASWPLTDAFELFGRVGFMDWDAEFSVVRGRDRSHTDFLYGAGAAWWPSAHWRLSLAYERVEFDLDSIKLGLRYQF